MGILVQGVAIVTSIFSVPLTVAYLGTERYGIWLTLNSALTWLYLGQMGLGGNALVTRLSKSLAAKDNEETAALVSSAFFALIGVAVTIGLILTAIVWGAEWRSIFNASARVSADELSAAVAVSLFLFLTLFPSTVVDAVFVAHHEGYIASGWALAANLLSFGGLLYAVSTKASLPVLVGAVFGARVVSGILAGATLFARRPTLLPRPGNVSKDTLRSLGGLGARYLVAQLTSMGMFQSQPFIVSQILGPASVGVFGVTQRLITLPLIVVQSMANAHTAAYAAAASRGEWVWLRRTLMRNTLIATIGGAFVLIIMAFIARPLIRVWAGPEMVPSASLPIWLALYGWVSCLVTDASSFLYAVERVGRQARYGIINAVLTITLGIGFTSLWGLPGLGAAMFVSLALVNPAAQWSELKATGLMSEGKSRT